ncbi:hypothetical protein BDV93DRAFT_219268 [Ceratobasidium sp. AG-I]|nr:hypothetical protein BDV93DRAFT_219268 [Ceratobasidium sp. AG-I]
MVVEVNARWWVNCWWGYQGICWLMFFSGYAWITETCCLKPVIGHHTSQNRHGMRSVTKVYLGAIPGDIRGVINSLIRRRWIILCENSIQYIPRLVSV